MIPSRLALVLPVLHVAGCFLGHGRGDGEDRPDAGPTDVIDRCEEAWSAAEGTPCLDWRHACHGDGRCCSETTTCRDGRVHHEMTCLPGCSEDAGPGTTFCPGYTPPTPPARACRRDEECAATGEICLAPGESPGCGPCRPPERPCEPDGATCVTADGMMGRCVDYLLECTCTGELSTRCDPYCSVDTDCPTGWRCAPSSARCYLPTCDGGGIECGPNRDCAPGDPRADPSGCVRRNCMFDSDCECGACVDDDCRDGPGICTFPAV